MIQKGSSKARKKAVHAAAMERQESRKQLIESSLTLFSSIGASDKMEDFVAHAPDDVEDLLTEVFCLKETITKLREERDQARKDLLGHRAEAGRLQERLTDIRRAWRTLVQEMGAKP